MHRKTLLSLSKYKLTYSTKIHRKLHLRAKLIKFILQKINPLSAKFIKWSNTLKQFVGKLPTNCLSVFDHFVRLALKGLKSGKTLFTFISTLQYFYVAKPVRRQNCLIRFSISISMCFMLTRISLKL